MSAALAKGEKPQQIQVFVRTRPISRMERDNRSVSCIELIGPKDISIKQLHGKKYSFDKVFGPNTKQVDVYLTVVYPLIAEVLAGYNCTVFAYGQTGAGKTYTMAGGSALTNNTWQDDESAGIIPRALAHLFDELRVLQQENTVRVSYLELYNEELYDLLAEADDASRIRIYEDQHQKGSVVIQGIEEQTVLNKNEVYKILEKGQEKRRTASTLMNAQSSRSHTVFTITVHTRETTVEGEMVVKTGKLHLVDLAGSENIGKSGAVDKRAREAGSINQSLLTLGRVIKALVERGQHIPYRESKLTRILQDSLGGRTKTSIIANISLASSNIEETLSTLEYANRARNITNRPEVNLRTSQKGLITEYLNEINRLRKDISAARNGVGVYLAQENYDRLMVDNEIKTEELAEKIVLVREIQDKLKNVEEQKAYVESQWESLQASFEESKNHINKITMELEKTVLEKEEEKYVSKCYEDRALNLHNQATELLHVAKSSLKNEDELHKKIECIRDMANENVNSIRHVIKKIASMEHVLADNLIEHMKYTSKTNKTLMDIVSFSQHQIPETKQQSAEFRMKLLEEVNSSATKIFKDLSDAQRNDLETWITDVYTNCAATARKQTDICNLPMDGLFKSLLDSVNENQQNFETFCIYLNEQIKDISKSLNECCKSTESNVEKTIATVLTEFVKVKDYLTQQENCLNEQLPRIKTNKKEIQELVTLLTKATHIIKVLENDASANERDNVQQSTLNQHCLVSLTNLEDKLQNELPPVFRKMNEKVEDIVQKQETITNRIDFEKNQKCSDTSQQTLIQKIQMDTKIREDSIVKETQTLAININKLSEHATNKLGENHANSEHAIELHIHNITEMLKQQQNKDEEVFAKSDDNLSIIKNELINLEDRTNKKKEMFEHTLNNTQEELLRLANNESLVSRNFGDTPVRMRLPSSIKVSQPTPRQRIVMRYKEKHMQNLQEDTFTEHGCASTSSISGETTIREEAPLKILNDPGRHTISNPNFVLNVKHKLSTDSRKSQKENISTE